MAVLTASDAIILCLPSCTCYLVCLQAFCTDVLQQPAEDKPRILHKQGLPRLAMRSYWL